MTGYAVPPEVAVVEEDDVVYAAILPDGPIVVLDGIAGAIWSEAGGGPSSTIADRVSALTGASVADIRIEVEAFIEELVRRGLLSMRDG